MWLILIWPSQTHCCIWDTRHSLLAISALSAATCRWWTSSCSCSCSSRTLMDSSCWRSCTAAWSNGSLSLTTASCLLSLSSTCSTSCFCSSFSLRLDCRPSVWFSYCGEGRRGSRHSCDCHVRMGETMQPWCIHVHIHVGVIRALEACGMEVLCNTVESGC